MTDEWNGIEVRSLGGNCPVQAYGKIDGHEFYFRARGEHWSLGVGSDPIGEPEWRHEEEYGTWPEAGWMPESEARAFILKAAGMFRKQRDEAAVALIKRFVEPGDG